MNNLHMKFLCKWCGRKVGGCADSCAGPHSHEEVESCATCAHRPAEELAAIAAMPDDAEVTHSILALVMDNPPTLRTVDQWMPGQRRAAEEWARTELEIEFYEGTTVRMGETRRCPSFIRETEDVEVFA